MKLPHGLCLLSIWLAAGLKHATRLKAFLRVVFLAAALQIPTTACAEFYPGNLTAFFTRTTPALPAAGESFVLNVVSGPCEFLAEASNSATVDSFSNGTLTIRIPGVPSDACNFDFGPREYAVPGQPAGNYRIDLVFYRIEQPGDIGVAEGFIGGRDVTVVAGSSAAVASIPTISLWSGLLFGFVVMFLARRRYQ